MSGYAFLNERDKWRQKEIDIPYMLYSDDPSNFFNIIQIPIHDAR